MSSILKALKKLEEDKSQRDELSTAVSSDILRSSRRKGIQPVQLVVSVAVACGLIVVGYLFAVTRDSSPRPATLYSSTQLETPRPPEPQETVDREPVVVVQNRNLPRLSGIIYQDDPESRLAIVNDLPVMEGTTVEGYTVRAIRPDGITLGRDEADYVIRLEEK